MRFSNSSRQLYAIWCYNYRCADLQQAIRFTNWKIEKKNGNLMIGSIEIKNDNLQSKFLTIPNLKFFQFKLYVKIHTVVRLLGA